MSNFTESLAKKKLANRGKSAEGDVAAYLTAKDADTLHFDWHRGYDARSAGGKFQRIAGDFSFYRQQDYGIFEVKEIAHEYRMPYKNYDFSKVAKARKRQLAGGRVLVLILSTKTDKWCWKPIDFFRNRNESVGSWDLRGARQHDSCDEILDHFFATDPRGNLETWTS